MYLEQVRVSGTAWIDSRGLLGSDKVFDGEVIDEYPDRISHTEADRKEAA